MRILPLALGALLVVVQADLWFGKGSMRHVAELRRELETQRTANDVARERNARLAGEVDDLVEGLEMVEEKARSELGMIKPDEILVQIRAPR